MYVHSARLNGPDILMSGPFSVAGATTRGCPPLARLTLLSPPEYQDRQTLWNAVEEGLDCRIDHRSYERQGIEQIPTVHEGPAVRQMEANGIRTDKGDLNRWIRETNDLLRKIKTRISELTDWLKSAEEELSKTHRSTLADVLGDYYQTRNAGAYSQKARVGNLKRYAADIAFLESRGLATVDNLHDFVSALSVNYFTLRDALHRHRQL